MKKETENYSEEDIEQALVVVKTLAKWQYEVDELRRKRILLLRALSTKLIFYCRKRRAEILAELSVLGRITKDNDFRFKSLPATHVKP